MADPGDLVSRGKARVVQSIKGGMKAEVAMVARATARVAMSGGRLTTPQFVGQFSSVAALPTTSVQVGDWAVIATGPASTSALHFQGASWDGAAWTTYSVNEGANVTYPDNVILGAAGFFLPARRNTAQRNAL